MPDMQHIAKKCTCTTEETGPSLISTFCRTWAVKFWERSQCSRHLPRGTVYFTIALQTWVGLTHLVFKSVLARDENYEIILTASRHRFSAQFDCHSTVKHTFFLACPFQSNVAGLDAVISKTSNVSVCFRSNFAWDNFISHGIPQTKHILILSDTLCDLNEKDKINTGLAFSIVISLSVVGNTVAFSWQVFSCS